MIRGRYDKSKLVQEFEKESTQKAINDTKIATIIGCILYPIYSVLDLFVYPDYYLEFLIIRATVVGACLSVFGLMHTKFGKTYPKVIGTVLYIIGCLSIVLMVHRVGNKITVAFVPALNVVHEQVDMDSPEPTANEIAEKTGVDA